MSTTPEPVTAEMQPWFEAWKACAQNVLSQASSQAVAFEVSSELLQTADSDLCFTIVTSGAIDGEMALRIPYASATRLVQKFLGEAEPATDLTSERKKALEELLRQIAGLAATMLAPAAGGEVRFRLSASSPPSWPPAVAARLRTRNEAGEMVVFEIQISAELISALQSAARKAEAECVPAERDSVAEVAAPPDPPPAHYGRLLDVGLEVKLRFGTRRMHLRDVLALSSGFVVELDNKVQSPADLMLDGRVIARGEVVVVDGKYGLRITEIPELPPFS